MTRVYPGWAATLASWQSKRDPMTGLRDTADKIIAALDSRPEHQQLAMAALTLRPYYELCDDILACNAGLWALDLDEAELALELWRAERTHA